MGFYEFVLIFYFLFWYLLIAVLLLFLISGLDDAFFDIYYWIRYGYRKWKTRKFKPLTYEQLKEKPELNIAVMLPCWHEANVISTMLLHNCSRIEYNHYDIFVGVYPNDPDTVNAVTAVSKQTPHVHAMIGAQDGPTNKASNLNQVYQYIKQYEQEHQKRYDIFVFHDSEDIIHPLSFRLYNYLIPRKDMVQIPVFPLGIGYFKFTHWLYCDEFCEVHTKDIIVREAIRGLVPSAGVGTAFSRSALETLASDHGGKPFSTYSLTEDYKTALSIRLKNLKQIFVLQYVWQTKFKKRLFSRKYRKVRVKDYIATRALFPMEYIKAVRQKARWITGISIQEWIHTGWVGNFSVLYTLIHDRKSLFTHFINMMGYVVFFFWFLYYYLAAYNPVFPSLQEQFNLHPWVWYMVLGDTVLMIERMLQRFIATTRIYGWFPALLSIPRVLYGNIINFHALVRAYRQVLFPPAGNKKGKPLAWDKTEHHFPGSHALVPLHKRLGDLLVENHLISAANIESILGEQKATGARLGDLLEKYNYVTQLQLNQTIARQYQLELLQKKDIRPLKRNEMPGISAFNYYWLRYYKAMPLAFDKKNKTIKIGIMDPSNEDLIINIQQHMIPYKVDFVMIG